MTKVTNRKKELCVEQSVHSVSRLRDSGNILERKTETFWSKTNIVFFLSLTKHFLRFFFTVDVEFVSRLGFDSRAQIKFRHQLFSRVSKKNYVCFLSKRFGLFFQNISVGSQFWHWVHTLLHMKCCRFLFNTMLQRGQIRCRSRPIRLRRLFSNFSLNQNKKCDGCLAPNFPRSYSLKSLLFSPWFCIRNTP